LDLDKDGTFDTGEPSTSTDSSGKYTFADVPPGGYQVFVVSPTGDGCAVVSPRPATVDVVSGQRVEGVNFTIAFDPPPVVEGVEIGSTIGVPSWQTVPAGTEQTSPFDLVGKVTHIAIEVCASGIKNTPGSGNLRVLNAEGVAENSVTLSYVSTSGSRIIYAVGSSSSPVALAAGRYLIDLPATVIADNAGRILDGEWAGPTKSDPRGSYFPSGNGTAGGDFQFEFVIEADKSAGMPAAAATATSGAVATTATIQGSVWWHDGSPTMGRTANEQGLKDVKVRLINQATGNIAQTTVTDDSDLNGDGMLSLKETGVFEFTGVLPGTYVVSQTLSDPWVQKTPGGVTQPAELL
ncbi:hypothetical protein EBU58_15920, partial [bacterium]|nr:hypothetical protein [bacterium]